MGRRRFRNFSPTARRSARTALRCRPAVERLEARELLAVAAADGAEQWSVARMWNEQLLDAIRIDTPRPTVHARNLFHTSVAMYDAWAVYDPAASPYLSGESIPLGQVADLEEALDESVSYAAYRVLTTRFAHSPGAATSLAAFDDLMGQLGYDPGYTAITGNDPAAVGNRIAASVLAFGQADGANERNNYADLSGYLPVNEPGDVRESGTHLIDANHWQPLVVDGVTQSFLTPHWGDVTSFASGKAGPDEVLLDPGLPPQLGGPGDAEFKEAIVRVLEFSSRLDPTQSEIIDVSPAVIGDNDLGTNNGDGHALNPITGQPYPPNLVNAADYGRVLAEYWADGPRSETPPGHWNAIANSVNDTRDSLGTLRQVGGQGPAVDELQWDVKLYLTLNGALHDAAVAAWDAKEAYDYVRPITMVRHMGGRGQSSDPALPSYHPEGLPLVDQLIELVTADSVADGRHAHLADHIGEIAVHAWQGHPDDPDDVGGVDWILAEDWMPYQAADFVTPAFAGYTSGHSTFSRAAAEVLTRFTGSEFFPNGLGGFFAAANEYLRFEGGPTEDVMLQWATYYDAADEAGISRLHGGIHVDADDFQGRRQGAQAGTAAYQHALHFFAGDGVAQQDRAITSMGETIVRRAGSNLRVTNRAGEVLLDEPLEMLRSLRVTGGAWNDTLIVDFQSGGGFSLPGGITFDAGGGHRDEVEFRGGSSSEIIELHADWIRFNSLTVWSHGVDCYALEAGGGNNEFRLSDPSLDGKVEIHAGHGDDTYRLGPSSVRIKLVDAGGTDALDFRDSASEVQLNLRATYWQRPAGDRYFLQLHGTFEDVHGSAHDDVIHGNAAANVIRGGGGDDTLFGHGGNDILLGGPGRDVVEGQEGDDVLSGDDHDDALLDFLGENVLIGGRGQDVLNAGPDEDLLISGHTLYDHYAPALRGILAEWTRRARRSERLENLRQGGGQNGSYVLQYDETVWKDEDRDLLLSGQGWDWQWDDAKDHHLILPRRVRRMMW